MTIKKQKANSLPIDLVVTEEDFLYMNEKTKKVLRKMQFSSSKQMQSLFTNIES